MVRTRRRSTMAERRKAFDEVQKIFAEHLPVMHFAAPTVFVVASSRVTNLTPAASGRSCSGRPDTHRRIREVECRRRVERVRSTSTDDQVPGPARCCSPPSWCSRCRRRRWSSWSLRRATSPSISSGVSATPEEMAALRARYGLDRPLQRPVPRVAVARRSIRFRPVARERPSRQRAHLGRRVEHGGARRVGAAPRHARRAAARRRSPAPRRRRSPAGGRAGGVGASHLDAAAPDVAVPGLPGGAHRLVSDRRHELRRCRRRRSAAPHGRAGAGAGPAAVRDVRAPAGAGDLRGDPTSPSCWPPSPAACRDRGSSGATPSRRRSGRWRRSTGWSSGRS